MANETNQPAEQPADPCVVPADTDPLTPPASAIRHECNKVLANIETALNAWTHVLGKPDRPVGIGIATREEIRAKVWLFNWQKSQLQKLRRTL